ncbi:MAG: hypothetical protein ACE5H9_21830 [Anaerolineae bacterium]
MGNQTAQTRTLAATAVTTYTYDATNRLDYFYEDGLQTGLTWDAKQLAAAREYRVHLCWDAANRLVGTNVGGLVSSYKYNGLGQRTAQTVDGLTTEYVQDVGSGLPQVIAESTGGQTAIGLVSSYNCCMPSRAGSTAPRSARPTTAGATPAWAQAR